MSLDRRFADLIINAQGRVSRETRNAVTQSYFGHHLIVDDLTVGHFPVLLGRKMFLEGIIGEMAAMLRGPKCVEDFKKFGCNYWDAWGEVCKACDKSKTGSCGKSDCKKGKLNVDYGNAWIDFNGVDQLEDVVESLKDDPNGRRHIITGWRPDHLDDLSLPCCHYAYQWYVNDNDELEMIWIQRSVDIMIGLPSDIVLAAVWNILMAQTVGLKPGRLNLMLGDCHIYENHLEGITEYLQQASNASYMARPTWKLDPDATVFNFVPAMLEIKGYDPMPSIKFELVV